MPEFPTVFISYAHRDGGELAVRLQRDLASRGIDAWLDTERLLAGDRWTNEIEAALDRAQVVLALVSEGSFTSDTCRAEQGWALDAGKRVIPLRVENRGKMWLRLYPLQLLDFSDPTHYAQRFQELLASIGKGVPVSAPRAGVARYNNAPALPENFVDRPEILHALRDALFQEAASRNLALTALQGMGGIGKTVLAQALCRDAVVQHAFPDGIFWFTIGKESGLGFDRRMKAVPGLDRLLGAYEGAEACASQYRNALRDMAALIVLDDVWRAGDIDPFRTEAPRSRLLITTRDMEIAPTFGAREFTADLLSEAKAREVLARWAGLPNPTMLPAQAERVIGECQNLPLALAMIGAQLRGKPLVHWDIVLGHLGRADLARIEARFPEPHTTLFRAIQVSVDALDGPDRSRYLALAVVLENMVVAPAVQQTLWNLDEGKALETADRLVGLSLARRDGADGGIRLHDLQLDYVRAEYGNREALEWIHGAVRLSAHVLEKDARQFASQMVGRLLPYREVPAIEKFLDEITMGAPRPWVRALQPALDPPGKAMLRTLEGHSGPVWSVAVTGDGKRAVSASADGTLKVWELGTGRLLRTLKGHSADVRSVALTPEGAWAISASWDKTLAVWDLETGLAVRTLEGHSAPVCGVAATPDGTRAISASWDGTLRLWDLAAGRALRTVESHSDLVSGVAVTADGTRAVSASWDSTLKVWELKTGRDLRTLEGHSAAVWAVALTADGRQAVSASDDRTLKVWDLATGRALRTLEGHSGSVRDVKVTADGKLVVSASWDNTLKIWNLETGHLLGTLEGHSDSVSGVAVTMDGARAVSASEDRTLKVWDLKSGGASWALGRHSEAVTGLAVAPGGKHLVSSSRDQTLKVWDLATGRLLRTLEGHSGRVHGVAVTPDGKRAISASEDKTLKVWSLANGRVLRTLEGHTGSVVGVAVTADGKRAVSASYDQTLKVWNLANGRLLRTLSIQTSGMSNDGNPSAGPGSRRVGNGPRWVRGHSDLVSAVAVTLNGKRAVSASMDRTLGVWDLATGRMLLTLKGHSADVRGVAVTADGKRVLSASEDHTVKLWDLETGCIQQSLEGHSGRVYGVALTADGERAASASLDRTLKVWELDTGLLLATFQCDAPARCCAFVDDRRIVAGDAGGRVYILSLEE